MKTLRSDVWNDDHDRENGDRRARRPQAEPAGAALAAGDAVRHRSCSAPTTAPRLLHRGERPRPAAIDGARWAIWRWYQVRRTTRQLSHLADHMLKDIGLSRSMLINASMRRAREEEEIRRRLNAY